MNTEVVKSIKTNSVFLGTPTLSSFSLCLYSESVYGLISLNQTQKKRGVAQELTYNRRIMDLRVASVRIYTYN